jgi:hypothetical protein
MKCEDGKTKINTKMETRDRIDLQIEISPLPYVNAEIFERYVDTILVPAVEANRQLPGCDKTSHFVLRQLFSLHVESNVREVSTACGSCSLVPVSYVTYISSSGRIIVQPCQAIQKYQICDDTLPIDVDHILRLFRAYEVAMASTTIRAAWRQT